jgi:hypothetical protein
MKKKYREDYVTEGEEEDVNIYGMTLREREDFENL